MSKMGAVVLDDMELGAALGMAQETLRSACAELATAFRAKGYPKASISIEVREKDISIRAHSGGPKVFEAYRSIDEWNWWHADTLLEAYTRAAAAIALVENATAYDDDFRAPLFLLSEQRQTAEAAE